MGFETGTFQFLSQRLELCCLMLSLMGKIGICIFVDDNNLYRCEKQFPAKLHSLSYAMQIILNLLNNFPKGNSRNYKSMSVSDQQWGTLQLKIINLKLKPVTKSSITVDNKLMANKRTNNFC